MSYRLIPLGSSRVRDRPRGLRMHTAAFVVACAACLIPFASSAANFTATPANLVFGGVPLGATATLYVTITNTSIVVRTLNLSGGAPSDTVNFRGTQNCQGVTMGLGGSCQITYEFHPTTLGAKSASTTINVNGDVFSITMSGTGIGGVTVAPTTINFGSVLVGNTSVTRPATVTNVSGAPLQVSLYVVLGSGPFNATQSCAGVTLAAGGTCQFFYTFKPAAPGPASSVSNFTVNDQTFSVSLSGSGFSGLALAPATIQFGPVLVGTTSSGVVAKLTNVSGAPLGPLVVAGGGVSPPFTMTQNCQGAILANGGSCAFGYAFTPFAAGPAITTSTFTVNGDAFTVALLGTGSVPQIEPLAVIEFYNASLDHYFITHAADEIAKLDAGVVIKGWTRTGKSFKAFATGQAGATDICRIYIIPLHGDSHFFGRGQQECDDTMAAHPDFFMEESRFMAMILPVAGVCPAGTVPVYRVFSKRPDANHRYTIERAVRTSMEALGWLAEGDGPDFVVMCAPS